MMEPIMIAAFIGIAVYIFIVALIPRRVLLDSNKYTKSVLKRLESEAIAQGSAHEETVNIMREQIEKADLLTRVFFTLPGSKFIYPKLLKAGIAHNINKFVLVLLLIGLLVMWFLRNQGIISIFVAVAVVYIVAWYYVRRCIKKRSAMFLNHFPDALDMIVRSVKSGYPLAGAIRMVADNMSPPISSEFKQVADETAYGSTLVDALKRLCQRIDEPDIKFFVVVLSVQQEVGGNLAEVLSNLSSIIRKRKHLRLKVRAITSEGRATAWVLGSLPGFVFIIINKMSPKHMEPLFDTVLGNMLLAGAIGIVLLGGFIITKMSDVEV
ncbi:MAG: type II secretion system F family protein [Alphaproteobacteria bacterium]